MQVPLVEKCASRNGTQGIGRQVAEGGQKKERATMTVVHEYSPAARDDSQPEHRRYLKQLTFGAAIDSSLECDSSTA